MKKQAAGFLLGATLLLSFNGTSNADSSVPYNSVKKNILEQTQNQRYTQKAFKSYKQSIIKSAANDEITYEIEPNNTIYTANPLKLGTYIAGDFSFFDIDTYKITVPKSGILIVSGGYQETADMDLGFLLYDKYDEPVEMYDYLIEGTTEAQAYQVSAGTYYISAIDVENYASGDYYLISATMMNGTNDTVAPEKPKVNPVDDNDNVVSGTAEPGSYVWVQVGNNFVNKGTLVQSNGKYSVSIKPQKAGTFIGVSAVDNAGNQSEFTKLTVLDKTPPSTLSVEKVTSKSTVVKGKTEANAAVVVKAGKTHLGKATADTKGNFKVTIKALKKGTQLTITATDKAMNQKVLNYKVN